MKVQSLPFSSAAVSDRGLSEKRPQNEDSYLEMSQCGIFAVADGVGGAQAGEVASQMAVEILGEAFANKRAGEDAETTMQAAIAQANFAIYQMARELPQLSSMATTIVALHLSGEIATIGHVGDSRLYRLDRSGVLFPETDDHSMVADEVRAGRMTVEQAEHHPGRNIINRALGAEPAVEIDLKTIMIEPDSAFLLCSDGITRHVTDDEIKGVLTFGGSPEDVCSYLKDLCYERGAEDNLTAVVVRVGTNGAAPLQAPEPEVMLELEESTVASARVAGEVPATIDEDEDILGIDTLELERPEPLAHPKTVVDEDPEESNSAEPPLPNAGEESEEGLLNETNQVEESPTQFVEAAAEQQFSMFGSGDAVSETAADRGSMRSILGAFVMLVIGSLIGLGVYHYALAPNTAQPNSERFSVMKSDDIALTSFENVRRKLDADPAAYIREVPPAQDAADHYLLGRAYLLTGDIPKARLALIEAQKLLPSAEPTNARVLVTDVTTALAIVNDPVLSGRIKQDVEATLNTLSGNTNTNSTR